MIKVKFSSFQVASKMLSKLIDAERNHYQLLKNMKMLYGIPKNNLTNVKLWKYFSKGYSVHSMRHLIPEIFYTCGVESWLEKEYQHYLKAKDSKNVSIENLTPSEVISFDFKREVLKAKSEMIVWKKIEKLKEMFD